MQTRTIGSMATIKSRLATLEAVVESIASQLDVLYVYLNDHDSVPQCLAHHPNVVPIFGKNSFGDLNANGKMIFLEHESDGVAFTLDDDVIYPANYVSKFLAVLKAFRHQACLSVHGSVIPDHAAWYYERSWTYAMKDALPKRCAINLVGSGTCVFPIRLLDLSFATFQGDIYVDLQISHAALKRKIPVVAIERAANWTRPILDYPGLWADFRGRITHHTHLLLGDDCWKSDALRAIWRRVFSECESRGITDPGKYLKLASETIGFIHGEPSLVANDDLSSLRKIQEFSRIWTGQ